jgi:hypothetical protein
MRENRKGLLWYLVSGAVELSWFLGWAMFCSLVVMKQPFPFLETVIAFALAVSVTRLVTGKRWRIITVLGTEIPGFVCAALLLIHGIYHAAAPLWERGWLMAFFRAPRDVMEGMILALNLLLIGVLWALGAALARRARGYASACIRFDFGLAAFFALFIIKLVALTKGEPIAEDSLSQLFIFPFFFFGLLAIGMARLETPAARAFLPGYRGMGVIVSFVVAVLLGAGGVLLFFLPGLTAAAQLGYRALSSAAKPLLSVLIVILRFLFGPHNGPAVEVAAGSPLGHADLAKMPPEAQSWWMALLDQVLAWGALGLAVILGVLMLAAVVYYTVRWLLSRTQGEERQAGLPLPVWLARFFAVLRACWAGIWRKIQWEMGGYPRAALLYGALLRWAGRSGLPQERGETPLEFGMRLTGRFAALAPQIDRIIGAYNREVYGQRVLAAAPLGEANSAWRFLRSPRRWPVRLKGLVSAPSRPGATIPLKN